MVENIIEGCFEVVLSESTYFIILESHLTEYSLSLGKDKRKRILIKQLNCFYDHKGIFPFDLFGSQ